MRRCFRSAEEARLRPEEDGRGEIEKQGERKRKDQEEKRRSGGEVVARMEEYRRRAAAEGTKKREERERERRITGEEGRGSSGRETENTRPEAVTRAMQRKYQGVRFAIGLLASAPGV